LLPDASSFSLTASQAQTAKTRRDHFPDSLRQREQRTSGGKGSLVDEIGPLAGRRYDPLAASGECTSGSPRGPPSASRLPGMDTRRAPIARRRTLAARPQRASREPGQAHPLLVSQRACAGRSRACSQPVRKPHPGLHSVRTSLRLSKRHCTAAEFRSWGRRSTGAAPPSRSRRRRGALSGSRRGGRSVALGVGRAAVRSGPQRARPRLRVALALRWRGGVCRPG
jgi:hypothetical protein